MSLNVNNWTKRDQAEVDAAFAAVNYFQARPLTGEETNELAYYCYLYGRGLITEEEQRERTCRITACGSEVFDYFFANAEDVRREMAAA